MSNNEQTGRAPDETIHGYSIMRSIVFENDRGFALAVNPAAVSPFVTWQFTEDEKGLRDYYWGHYAANGDTAARDYEGRVTEYQKDYGVSEKGVYKYYSTQRPVDIGTFPKTESGPTRIVNFDSREAVEKGQFRAWGYLEYKAPLTAKQIYDYELRPAPGNFDFVIEQNKQVQAVGKWEQAHRVPDVKRLTWWYPDFGVFVKNECVTPTQLAERYGQILERQARADKPKSIAQQLKEGAEQAARDSADRPAPDKAQRPSHEDR